MTYHDFEDIDCMERQTLYLVNKEGKVVDLPPVESKVNFFKGTAISIAVGMVLWAVIIFVTEVIR